MRPRAAFGTSDLVLLGEKWTSAPRDSCLRRPGTKCFQLPIALVEGRRRAYWYRPGATDGLTFDSLKSFIRSIGLSLNRRFGGNLSTGFTRAISICGKVAVVGSITRIVADSCACAASDHAAAMPPNRLMNSPRVIRLISSPSNGHFLH